MCDRVDFFDNATVALLETSLSSQSRTRNKMKLDADFDEKREVLVGTMAG